MTSRPFFGVPLLRFGHDIRWCFAVSDVFRKGCLAVCSCFGGCLIAAAPQQQQQQPPAAAPAAGSSKEQQAGSSKAAAGSSRQHQAAAGSSRQQQTPAEAVAGSGRQRQSCILSRVSEVTLGPFLGFLCYVLGTTLGGVLLFRICFERVSGCLFLALEAV